MAALLLFSGIPRSCVISTFFGLARFSSLPAKPLPLEHKTGYKARLEARKQQNLKAIEKLSAASSKAQEMAESYGLGEDVALQKHSKAVKEAVDILRQTRANGHTIKLRASIYHTGTSSIRAIDQMLDKHKTHLSGQIYFVLTEVLNHMLAFLSEDTQKVPGSGAKKHIKVANKSYSILNSDFNKAITFLENEGYDKSQLEKLHIFHPFLRYIYATKPEDFTKISSLADTFDRYDLTQHWEGLIKIKSVRNKLGHPDYLTRDLDEVLNVFFATTGLSEEEKKATIHLVATFRHFTRIIGI